MYAEGSVDVDRQCWDTFETQGKAQVGGMSQVLECPQQLLATFMRGVKDPFRHEGYKREEVRATTVGHKRYFGSNRVDNLG